MSIAAKGLWYIDSHCRTPMKIGDAAAAAGVSRYHFARAFTYAVGMSPRRYLRRRRVALAWEAIEGGAQDLLTVALDVGYGSHEAFSRAFRAELGVTPEQARAQGLPPTTHIQAAIRYEELIMSTPLDVRVEERKAFRIAGLERLHDDMPSPLISEQWQRFAPHIGQIPNQVGMTSYGAMPPEKEHEEAPYRYLCAVEVSSLEGLPDGLTGYDVEAGTYAIAQHRDHVSSVGQSFAALYGSWLPASGYEPLPGYCLEVYGAAFDPMTGNGGFELWVPVRSKSS
ncbi:MAG: AraC family transcriptional regulator [Pseudomonadota bacterium]